MPVNGYDFYVDKCLLPVTPAKLQLKINNANKTMTLIDGQQINMLKEAELTDIEFECLLPQVKYPFAVYKSGFLDAFFFIDYFEQLKTNRKPFQFIVARRMPGGRVLSATNMRVSMESYTITEEAKEGFDFSVKIKLKQYRDYSAKTVNLLPAADGLTVQVQEQRGADNAPQVPQNYVVEKGDCLWNIAKRLYGDGRKWKEIYDANKNTVGGNPNLVYPGQELTLPTV